MLVEVEYFFYLRDVLDSGLGWRGRKGESRSGVVEFQRGVRLAGEQSHTGQE